MSNELATVNVNTMMNSEVGSTYCSIAVNGDRIGRIGGNR